jgi:serine/threonine-protein kinase
VEIMHFRELTERYSLDKILRSTRTGTVLRATDSRSGQAVAVKLVNVPSPAELVQRSPEFEKLTAALEALRHPNLPLLIDSGFTTEGSAFLVMELLEGRTLDIAGSAGSAGNAGSAGSAPASPQGLLALLYQALNGLEALARRGLAHHNLSPDNLLLVAGTEPERIKLLGLGTAVFRGAAAAPTESARYRAPELGTERAADWRADLFSFAATTCHLLGAATGPGDSPVVQLPFALSLELENSEALRQTLERALRHDPAERPSHQEMRDAIRLALGSDVPVPVDDKPPAPKLVIPAAMPATPAPKPAAVPAMPAASPAADLDDSGGELLSSVDDDLLDALSPSLAMPAPAAPVASVAPTVSAVPAAAPGNPGNVVPFQRRPGGGMSASVAEKITDPAATRRRAILLVSLAASLVVALGLAYWWFSRGTAAPPAPVAAEPILPVRPPRRPAAEVLQEAQLAFADGDDATTLEILGTLTAADQSALPPGGCRALQSLQATLQRSALERLPESLAQGLKGDIGRLRLAVAVAGPGSDLPEAVRADLERARGVVGLYDQIAEAAGRDAHREVLERFALLAQQLPGASDPQGLRDHAAASLEDGAEALAREGKYQEAVMHLAPVQSTWPNRAGLAARRDGYLRAEKDEAQQEALLAELPGLERRHLLDEALDKVRAVTPTPHLAAPLAEARQRLEQALAQIDGQAPQIVLRDGYYLDYDRGRVVELSFRISDDFKVRDIKLMARPQGGKMRSMPIVTTRLGYTTVKLEPSFHQNGTVEFYVAATDVSGHTGYFGSPDSPKQLKRREGFRPVLR